MNKFAEQLRAQIGALETERDALLTELDGLAGFDPATEGETRTSDQVESRVASILERGKAIKTDIAEKTERAAEIDATEAERRAVPKSPTFTAPNLNKGRGFGADVSRNLDDLLWATADEVRADNGARNKVEQVLVRSDAGDSGRPAPRIGAYKQEEREAIRNFQQTVADMACFGLLIDKDAKSSRAGFQVARGHRMFKDRWAHALRAMDIDTAAEGGNWVPTGIGATIHEKVRAAGKVAALFPRVDLPTNPWVWPLEGADATAYRVAEPTSDTEAKFTASTPGTNKATFDAEIFGVRALTSKFLEPDSAVAILPYLQRKIVQAMVDGEEKAIIDGDTDGTHQDSDIGASTTAAVTAWDGLRKKALAETTQATTTSTSANLAIIRKAMGKWGVNPMDLAFIVGVQSYGVLLSDTNLVTVDKFGPNATILSGQIGNIYGVPVIVSEWVRENLNASGVYDGITTTKTFMLCVNRNEWAMGQRTALDIEADDSIYRETAQRVLVGFMREDFQCITSATTDDATSIGYNVTSGS